MVSGGAQGTKTNYAQRSRPRRYQQHARWTVAVTVGERRRAAPPLGDRAEHRIGAADVTPFRPEGETQIARFWAYCVLAPREVSGLPGQWFCHPRMTGLCQPQLKRIR
jgi:hypothetical protein